MNAVQPRDQRLSFRAIRVVHRKLRHATIEQRERDGAAGITRADQQRAPGRQAAACHLDAAHEAEAIQHVTMPATVASASHDIDDAESLARGDRVLHWSCVANLWGTVAMKPSTFERAQATPPRR
jgi:hypothetical protein